MALVEIKFDLLLSLTNKNLVFQGFEFLIFFVLYFFVFKYIFLILCSYLYLK